MPTCPALHREGSSLKRQPEQPPAKHPAVPLGCLCPALQLLLAAAQLRAVAPCSSHPAKKPSLPMATAVPEVQQRTGLLGFPASPPDVAACGRIGLHVARRCWENRPLPIPRCFVSLRLSQEVCRSPLLGWQRRLKHSRTVSATAVGESRNSRGCCRLG